MDLKEVYIKAKTVILLSLVDVVVQFFLCFSLIKNTSRIMDTNVPASAITSINGMRVLSMWWVILGHVYFLQVQPISSVIISKYNLLDKYSIFFHN